MNNNRFILCIVGSSGAGKTLLIETLIPKLIKRGLKVGTIKHDLHDRFDMDKPGKDTWRHKVAGASAVIASSPKRLAIIMDVDHDHSPEELIKFMQVDIVIAEGYKSSRYPKIEVVKEDCEPICKKDKNLIAIVSNTKFDLQIPVFSIKDSDKIADFVITYFFSSKHRF